MYQQMWISKNLSIVNIKNLLILNAVEQFLLIKEVHPFMSLLLLIHRWICAKGSLGYSIFCTRSIEIYC